MRLLVFGSTGGTGRQLLIQALDQDHSVTAYARDPAKIEDIQHSRLTVVRGDVPQALYAQLFERREHELSLRLCRALARNV
jgi:uncharacterized protein YbjT (DUF2867 family)